MAGTITLWVFGLLCFVVAFAKEAASGAGISLPGPKSRGARFGVVAVGVLALILGTAVRTKDDALTSMPTTPVAASTTPPVTAAPPAPSSPGPSTAAAPSPSPTGPAVAWSGPAAITMDAGMDFDLTPPGPASGFPRGIYATGFTATTAVLREEIQNEHDHFAVWTGQSAPTGAQCGEWATTHPGQSAHVSVGSLVCLKSPGGRTALIKVDSIAPADYAVNAMVTVWTG